MAAPLWQLLIALLVGVITGAAAMVLVLGRSRALRRALLGEPLSRQPLRPLKVSVPTFGEPRRRVFQSSEYGDEPLRCAGTSCGHRLLINGELFMEIPLPNQGSDALLAICMPCAYHGEHGLPTPKES